MLFRGLLRNSVWRCSRVSWRLYRSATEGTFSEPGVPVQVNKQFEHHVNRVTLLGRLIRDPTVQMKGQMLVLHVITFKYLPLQEESKYKNEGSTNINHLKVYCYGLAPSTNKKDLLDVFPTAIDVYLSAEDKYSKRHAYVQFETQEEVDKWVQSGLVTVNDEVVKLNYAGEKHTQARKLPVGDINHLQVYCHGLAPSTTKKDLQDVFPTARNIYVSPENQDNKRHAYVQFGTKEEVDKWVQSGLVTVNDKVVKLNYAGEKHTQGEKYMRFGEIHRVVHFDTGQIDVLISMLSYGDMVYIEGYLDHVRPAPGVQYTNIKSDTIVRVTQGKQSKAEERRKLKYSDPDTDDLY